MQDEPDPPRKFYKLTEAEFERVNPLPGAPQANGPLEVEDIYRHANAPVKLGPSAGPVPPLLNDVHAVLRDNLARANAAGLNELAPQEKRPSRRKRDYWILLILGDGFFGGALAVVGLKTIGGIYAFSGIIIYTLALTWVMWAVMDDY